MYFQWLRKLQSRDLCKLGLKCNLINLSGFFSWVRIAQLVIIIQLIFACHLFGKVKQQAQQCVCIIHV